MYAYAQDTVMVNRPRDPNQLRKLIVDVARGAAEDNRPRLEFGKLGGIIRV
jgi:hypothetical protein